MGGTIDVFLLNLSLGPAARSMQGTGTTVFSIGLVILVPALLQLYGYTRITVRGLTSDFYVL